MQKERTQTQTSHPSQKLTQNSLIDLNVKHTTIELVEEESQQSLAEQQSLDNVYGSERPEFPPPDLRSDILKKAAQHG